MKKSIRKISSERIIGIVAGMVLIAEPLFAQQSAHPDAAPVQSPTPAAAAVATPAQTGGPMLVTLPAGWAILGRSDNPVNQPSQGTQNVDPQSVAVVLAAAPVDTKRKITLSLISFSYRDVTPSLTYGALGLASEAIKFTQGVLMQGYAPSSKVVTQIDVGRSRRLLTIEITAKNAAGDERIFTDTAVIGPNSTSTPNYRLYTSRPSADAVAAQEIGSIIKSLNLPDPTAPAPAQAASGTPAPAAGLVQHPPPSGGGMLAGLAGRLGFGPSQRASQIVQDYHGALVIVEGNKGRGSGFLCTLDGHTNIITNAHVLADNTGIKLTSLDGTAFTTGSSSVAVGHDIVKLQTSEMPKVFEVMTDLDNNVKIGDAVMVPGNAEGAQVVRPVEGKIVGIGPNLIEVDAPFVQGNSGSPIIHEATGKVIGVATYLMLKKVAPQGVVVGPQGNPMGPVLIEARRFGYRIDSIKQWQAINWQIFYKESAQVSAIEDVSEDFVTMIRSGNHLNPADYKSPDMARAVKMLLDDVKRFKGSGSKADQDGAMRNFFTNLRAVSRADIAAFNSQPSYDYFHRGVEEEARFRDEIYDSLSKVLQNFQ